MPLTPPNNRDLIHTRTITCEGYEREDGLFDIDGWLTDAKTYSYPSTDRGEVKAGVPVHGMGLRITIDAALNIREAAAAMDYTPFNMCPSITPNFQRLVGLNLGKGFNNAVRQALGGTQGCVHLVDLLRPMANTAYQLLSPSGYKALKDKEARGEPVTAFFVNQCHAWKSDGDVTRDQFPSLYTGEG
ncbi:MAG: DUF2889 domain-containing protein [Proteobacteria bacterium]|nr:DUF2889 domain-containing protein [Pseudomonadota bacterium]